MTSLRIDDAPGGAWPEPVVVVKKRRHRERHPAVIASPQGVAIQCNGNVGHRAACERSRWIAASLRSSQ